MVSFILLTSSVTLQHFAAAYYRNRAYSLWFSISKINLQTWACTCSYVLMNTCTPSHSDTRTCTCTRTALFRSSSGPVNQGCSGIAGELSSTCGAETLHRGSVTVHSNGSFHKHTHMSFNPLQRWNIDERLIMGRGEAVWETHTWIINTRSCPVCVLKVKTSILYGWN